MMAKKKKGPAADALAALEALEMEETASVVPEEASQVTKAPKRKKKKGAKGPAAQALVALEQLETEGSTTFRDLDATL